VEDILAFLEIPKAVVSNSQTDRLALALSKTGLIDYFVGCMFSVDMVKQGKPAPDLYLMAAGKLGVLPEKCLAIEDSPTGVKAGKAAGMEVVGFTGGGHTFEGHSEALITAGASKVINNFSNFLQILAL
jgi:HAD superfamily hydrolase (TIGR01509 family)